MDRGLSHIDRDESAVSKLPTEERTMRKTWQVTIERENGDKDVLILCGPCVPTIADYCKVLAKKVVAGTCERCGE